MEEKKIGAFKAVAEIKAENMITVNTVECEKIRLTDEGGNVIGTICLRYSDRQLVLSFENINLRDGNVYLPDLSHVYVLKAGNSVSLSKLLGI